MAITSVDRAEWLHHPVTQEFLHNLRVTKQGTMEDWAKQSFPSEIENAAALGGIQVIDQILERVDAMRITDDNGEEIL